MGLSKLIKNYKELGHKEFFKKFKEGVDQITPLQQTESQITFTRITLVGIALGFAVSVYAAKNLWWLILIMAGAFGNTFVGLVALNQKKKMFLEFENVEKEVEPNGIR